MESNLERWAVTAVSANYLVSNLGRVASVSRKVRSGPGQGIRNVGGIFLCPYVNCSTGYLQVTLDGRKKHSVHKLVAHAFCEGYSEGLVVNHINGIKTDNNAHNLEWVTQSYNLRHPKLILGKRNIAFGRKSHEANKITPIKAVNISTGEEKKFACVMDAVREYGFDSGQISRCCHGKSKSHKGWIFQFNNHAGYAHKKNRVPVCHCGG